MTMEFNQHLSLNCFKHNLWIYCRAVVSDCTFFFLSWPLPSQRCLACFPVTANINKNADVYALILDKCVSSPVTGWEMREEWDLLVSPKRNHDFCFQCGEKCGPKLSYSIGKPSKKTGDFSVFSEQMWRNVGRNNITHKNIMVIKH